MDYRYDDGVEVEELFDLMVRMRAFDGDAIPAVNAFHMALRNRDKEAVSLRHTLSVTARRATDRALIGYLRILSDRAYVHYILDVMVDPEHRRCGIGSALVELAVRQSRQGGFIKIFLTALPGLEPFYARFGFRPGMSPVLTLRGEDDA